MAQPTNTFDTYDSVNAMREDLADVIYNISPTETPFISNASKGSATNTLHQWNTDSLSAVAVNAKVEGDTIILGAAVSLSGKYSTNGEHTQNGYNMAVKRINDMGGVTVGGKSYKFDIRAVF